MALYCIEESTDIITIVAGTSYTQVIPLYLDNVKVEGNFLGETSDQIMVYLNAIILLKYHTATMYIAWVYIHANSNLCHVCTVGGDREPVR